MRIVLFGASGSIGGAIAAEALARGHEVRAIARDPSRVTTRHERLGVDRGDVTDAVRVAEAAAEADVLISAVGGAADGRPEVVVDAAQALLAGLRQAGGETRLFVVGGAGSLVHPAGGTVSSQADFPDAWKPSSNAQARALDVLLADGGDVDWTYLSPAHVIEPGERTGSYRTGGDELVVDGDGESRITIPDYAVAVIDELERPRFRGRRFTIGY